MPTRPEITIIGGGLAGSEAAWQLAQRDHDVVLFEMRPASPSPAHHTDQLAELVCSNSFKSDDPATAPGILKRELEALGSMVLRTARTFAVPAGAALAVDRDAFSHAVTTIIQSHPNIRVVREESTSIPAHGPVIVATGPLTSPSMETALSEVIGTDRMHFFDAAAPVIDATTIDREVVFAASRYDKGGGADYLNCPMDREQYEALMEALVSADRIRLKSFETKELFQACQPIEEIARRGLDAARFGPMKPVGLVDPSTGSRPWAVVQLRPENHEGTAYNLVGFQTNLTFPEQRRVLRLIPGLGHAEFLRYGVMHRNTFVDAPRLLTSALNLSQEPRVWLAGQITGTEGYLEAVGTGLLAALNVHASLSGQPPIVLPRNTALGSLVAYATDPDTRNYQPMHVNIGLFPPLDVPVRSKRARYAAHAQRAGDSLTTYLSDLDQEMETPGLAADRGGGTGD